MYVVNGFLRKKNFKIKKQIGDIYLWVYTCYDFWQTSTVGFGPVLKESVTGLEECPGGEEQWREAAKRKDCANFAYNLSKPEEFLYHCVINSYLNQTVELCAKEILVFLGNLILYLHFHFFIFFHSLIIIQLQNYVARVYHLVHSYPLELYFVCMVIFITEK